MGGPLAAVRVPLSPTARCSGMSADGKASGVGRLRYAIGAVLLLFGIFLSFASWRDGIGFIGMGVAILAWQRFAAPGMKRRHDLVMGEVSQALVERRPTRLTQEDLREKR
jgi:hypothetical protein